MLSRQILIVVLSATALLAQGEQYHLGRVATADEIRARDISVSPDGRGLPPGHGTAREGRAIYRAKCASCHGEHGQGVKPNPALVGGQGTLTSAKRVFTVGSYWPYAPTVWEYIRRAMPPPRGKLRANEVYAVTAYVLHLNRIIPENQVLDQKTLPAVKMPNRNGFVSSWKPSMKHDSN